MRLSNSKVEGEGKMSVGEFTVFEYTQEINRIQDLIEDCIKRYESKVECKREMLLQHKIDPALTEIIWNRIEEKNQDFFKDYSIRLALIKQIKRFNILLEDLAFSILARLPDVPAPMHTFDQSPALNWQQASTQSQLWQAENMQPLPNIGLPQESYVTTGEASTGITFNAPDVYPRRLGVVAFGVPQDRLAMGMQQLATTHECGSSVPSLMTPTLGDVPYPDPQFLAHPMSFQENVSMSGPNVGSSQDMFDPMIQDPMMGIDQTDIDHAMAFWNPSPYSQQIHPIHPNH